MTTEKQVKAAAKMYECRDTAKRFFKDGYLNKITPYKLLLDVYMKKNKVEVLPAVMIMVQLETVKDNGMSQMLFFAAAVEMIEPSI